MHGDLREQDQTHAVPKYQDLEQQIALISSQLDQMSQANWRGRIGLAAATVALVLLVIWFSYSTYSFLEERFTNEKIESAVMAKANDLLPGMQSKIIEEVSLATPVVAKLAGERALAIMPDLGDRFMGSIEKVGSQIEADIRALVDESLRRVASKAAADVREDFPSFSSEQALAITERVHQELLVEGGDFVESLDEVIEKEQEKIVRIFDQLPVDQAAQQSEEVLQKKFIHHVLMMVDAIVAEYPLSEKMISDSNALSSTTFSAAPAAN
ncbi:MAG: hypothetical protein ABGW78_12415 [Pirellulales bacterium]